MADAEIDGRYIAFPTIQMIDGGLVRLNDRAALDRALTVGNFVEFPTAKEASEYAKGGYKTKKFNEVAISNREEAETVLPFSGGNISEERLKEISLPSDTPVSLLIKRFENFLPVASFDVKQNTNGFGTQAASSSEEITLEKAQERLLDRIDKDTAYIIDYGKANNYNFTDNEVAALASFIFNLGRGALGRVTADGTRSKSEIAEMMLRYNKAGGKRLQGLVDRRKDERNVFLGEVALF